MLHDLLPRPRRQFGIGGVEVHPRQTEADGRLALRFVQDEGFNGVQRFNYLAERFLPVGGIPAFPAATRGD